MISPFPGMNPYLEHPDYWSSFHFRLIGEIAAALLPQLSLQYYVEVETRTYMSDESDDEVLIGIPDAAVFSSSYQPELPESGAASTSSVATQTRPERVSIPMLTPVQERYLEIRESKTDAVITVIEVLSPKNKRAGEGRVVYEKKRRLILESVTHLVEIDLLRGGKAMPIVGMRSLAPYRILISRSEQRPGADLYGISLQQPLPVIPIPLKTGEQEPLIDFQALFNVIHEEARYAIRLDYNQPLPPPSLPPPEQQWLETLLAPIRGK